MGPCLCGDTECPSCGTAQGTYRPDFDTRDREGRTDERIKVTRVYAVPALLESEVAGAIELGDSVYLDDLIKRCEVVATSVYLDDDLIKQCEVVATFPGDLTALDNESHEPGCDTYSGNPCSCSPYKEEGR